MSRREQKGSPYYQKLPCCLLITDSVLDSYLTLAFAIFTRTVRGRRANEIERNSTTKMSSSASVSVPRREGEKAPTSRNMVRVVHTESTDTDNTDDFVSRYQHPQSGKLPPMKPHGSQMTYSMAYSPYQHVPAPRPTPHQLQSVVTTSFSTEERDEPGMARKGYLVDQRSVRVERRLDTVERRESSGGERDDRPQMSSQHTPPPASPARVPPSPGNQVHQGRPLPLHRAHTTGDYYPSSTPLKRNFYHHARQHESYNPELPPDFVPPKRAKANPPPRREALVSPTGPHGKQASSPHGWYPRTSSWEAEEQYHRQLSRAQSFPSSPSWNGQPHRLHASPRVYGKDGHPTNPTEYVQITPSRDNETSSDQWHQRPRSHWSLPSPTAASSSRFWGRDARATSREDDMDYEAEQRRRLAFAPPPYSPNVFRQHHVQYTESQGATDKMQMVADAAVAAEGGHNPRYSVTGHRSTQDSLSPRNGPNTEGLTLLALPEDNISLSETLCVVREVRLHAS